MSGADNQISIWDMSVEDDTEAATIANDDTANPNKLDLPPQLLFIHQVKFPSSSRKTGKYDFDMLSL